MPSRGGVQSLGVFGWSGDVDPGGLQAAEADGIGAGIDVVAIDGDRDALQGV